MEKLFFYLLLGFQHSETAFHRIVSKLPDVLAKLQVQVSKPVAFGNSRLILERLVEATYFMLNLFPDFPDLYAPLYKALKQIPHEPPDEKRVEGKCQMRHFKNQNGRKFSSYVKSVLNFFPPPVKLVSHTSA